MKTQNRLYRLADLIIIEAETGLGPPKKWWNKMKKKISSANPSYSDDQVNRTIGHIWYHNISVKKKKEIKAREGKKYGKPKK